MPRARLKVKPPGGPAELSAEYPDDEYRFVASRYMDDGVLTFFEAETSHPDAVIEFIDEEPEIVSYEVLHRDDHGLVIEFTTADIPAPVRAALDAGVLPREPLVVRDGWVIAEITTSQERLSQFKDELEAAGLPYGIDRVAQSLDPTELLTDHQRHVVSEAIERGYYDDPRGCSLTDLASALEVSKSSISGVLHRAEGHIVKEFFAEPVA